MESTVRDLSLLISNVENINKQLDEIKEILNNIREFLEEHHDS